MTEYITLGPTPAEESCAQVGSAIYYERMRAEAKAYIAQLTRMFPKAVESGVRFVNRSNAHDFGSYHEVNIAYDPTDPNQDGIAWTIENEAPSTWDATALAELKAAGFDPEVETL